MSCGPLRVRTVPYGHPDVQRLLPALQGEYVARYGGPDDTPIDPAELTPPEGVFLHLGKRLP